MKGGGGTLFREPSRRADGPAPLHASAPLPGRRRGSSGGRESNTPPPPTHTPTTGCGIRDRSDGPFCLKGRGRGPARRSALPTAGGSARPRPRPRRQPPPGDRVTGPGSCQRPERGLSPPRPPGHRQAPSAARDRARPDRTDAPEGAGARCGSPPPPASPHLCGAAPRRSPPPASSPAPSLPRGKRGALSPRPPVGCEPPRRPPPTPACGTARWRAGGRVRPTFEELHLLELEGDVVAAGENVDGAAGLREQVQVQLQPHPAAARPCHPPPGAARPAWAGGRRPPPG